MTTPAELGVGIGSPLSFYYPERNLIGVPSVWRRRAILVERIFDTGVWPIDPRAVELQPLTRRGRWLIWGHDLDIGKPRSFYLEAMRHVRQRCWLHLGIYDPLQDVPSLIGSRRPFAPTQKARLTLAKVIHDFRMLTSHRDDIWLNIGVFYWEVGRGGNSGACAGEA